MSSRSSRGRSKKSFALLVGGADPGVVVVSACDGDASVAMTRRSVGAGDEGS